MKMKPIIVNGWNLQDIANEKSNLDSAMGPMIGIGNHWCCAC
ncbi:hypothetical protein [Tepidimicrobium xylanilyticum]|nr:hypothetical protein [Tepidimicrobium xylanilyticum]GMG96529.1 hypothetical protein EN5CB1_13550 [Tepidimicrobium xylanilyticum]